MSRPSVRSFDFVDTLVARRCVHPFAVFDAIERASGHQGFAEIRIDAERAIYEDGEYVIGDIYRQLCSRFFVGEEAALRLHALELAAEYDMFIPIRRNCALVRPGDLVVSDLYLPAELIRRVLAEKCGLAFNPVYVSSHGKSRGHGWRDLAAAFAIEEHLGDSEHSDVVMAASFGIPARLTTVARMTPREELVSGMGFGALACAMREARLATWHEDPKLQELAEAQIAYNFPLVFLAALLLIELAAERSWRKLLFSSRDCFLLHRTVEALAPRLSVGIETEYFHTSRIARSYPSPGYLRYFERALGRGPTAVVDMCGTGWSLSRLLQAAGRPETPLVLLHHMQNPDLIEAYRAMGEWTLEPQVDSLIGDGNNVVLEAFNVARHGMVEDVVEVGGSFIPTYARRDDGGRLDMLTGVLVEAFDTALAAAARIDGGDLAAWRGPATRAHAAELYAALHSQIPATREVIDLQIAENATVLETIGARQAASALDSLADQQAAQ